MSQIFRKDFEKVEMIAGTILEVLDFPEANIPAFKLKINFGEYGIKWTCAQITRLYSKETLVGRQVVAVLNLPEKQIANFMSQCLVTGFKDANGEIVLTSIDKPVPNGARMY
jgi:tRNA-binding protein